MRNVSENAIGAESAPLIQGGLDVCADCGFPASGRSHPKTPFPYDSGEPE